MKRTKAQIKARTAAEEKGISLEKLAKLATYSGKFEKYGTDEDYSFSWIDGRLRLNDDKVAQKLVEHANTL